MSLVKFLCFPCIFYLVYSSCDYWYWTISWLTQFITLVVISWVLTRRFVRDVICPKFLNRVDVKDKLIVITGCASGFGFAAAVELNRLGYYVVAGVRDPEDSRAKKLMQSVSDARRFKLIKLEVTEMEDVKKARETVRELIENREEGVSKLYAFINNAGIALGALIEAGDQYDLQAYSHHIDVNYYAPVRLTRVMLPFIRKSRGRIIMVGSLSARESMPFLGPYSVSKAALAKFSDILRREVAPHHVKVIDIEPSFFKTSMCDIEKNVKDVIDSYKCSSEDVKVAYKDIFLKCISAHVRMHTLDRIIMSDITPVLDAIVQAVQSYEPDLVYPVAAPEMKSLISCNALMPWEIRGFVADIFQYLLQDTTRIPYNNNETVKIK